MWRGCLKARRPTQVHLSNLKPSSEGFLIGEIMQLTAMDLTTIPGIIILLNNREVQVEVDDTFTILEEKTVIMFRERSDSWYCAYDQVIALNDLGEGAVPLTEGDAWDSYGDVVLPIKVQVSVPLTTEILLKKRIGIL